MTCGTILTNQKNSLQIAATDGWINIEEIKMQGKRSLPIGDFLNGYEITDQAISYLESTQ